MNLTHSKDVFGRFCIDAEPTDYDGTPAGSPLIIEFPIYEVPESRLALAEALTFWTSASGGLHTDVPLHPATLEILLSLNDQPVVFPDNVRWKHSDVPLGGLEMWVDSRSPGEVPQSELSSPSSLYRLHLLRTASAAGNLATLRERWIPVNVEQVGSSLTASIDLWHRRLAVLAVLGTELEVGTYVVPASWLNTISDFAKYQKLFKSVGLTLRTSDFAKGLVAS
ncbi:hypothetical protein [Kocuria atrinae]|uniref:hypothetical protein n=1 Tax=Kocuria atrinae TaxID=592377 RepID=UPI0031DDFF3E